VQDCDLRVSPAGAANKRRARLRSALRASRTTNSYDGYAEHEASNNKCSMTYLSQISRDTESVHAGMGHAVTKTRGLTTFSGYAKPVIRLKHVSKWPSQGMNIGHAAHLLRS
jgi:hypothetical protein